MGLATIDSHSQKEHTEIHKIRLSLVLIRLVLTEIQRFKNVKIYKEMYGNPDTVSDSVRIAIHFFVNFDIFKWLYHNRACNRTLESRLFLRHTCVARKEDSRNKIQAWIASDPQSVPLMIPGARFSKAPETFRARKAIFSSSVSENGEVYTPETSCVKKTSVYIY